MASGDLLVGANAIQRQNPRSRITVTVGLGRISRGLRLPDSPQPTPAARSVSPGHRRPPSHADRGVLLRHSRSREVQAFQNRTWLPFVWLRRVEQSVHWNLNQPWAASQIRIRPVTSRASITIPRIRSFAAQARPAQQTAFSRQSVRILQPVQAFLGLHRSSASGGAIGQRGKICTIDVMI